MIRVHQVNLGIDEDLTLLPSKICKTLGIKAKDLISYTIYKEGLDMRKRHMCFSYIVDCEVRNEDKLLRKNLKNVRLVEDLPYVIPSCGVLGMKHRVVVVGFGPCGMFAAYILAKAGYKPIIIERGDCVEERSLKVEQFFKEQILDEESNVQYGEGGAGTFSDGKLTSRSKDPRSRVVLETLIEFGAPEDILYSSHPHIGTDLLKKVVVEMRKKIVELGGEIHFRSRLNDLDIQKGELQRILVNDTWYDCNHLVLAIGNSARDTYMMLDKHCVDMSCKDFALGVRIEHPQQDINESQYLEYANHKRLSNASYMVKMKADNGRGVYSFCMCPGGYVVASSSLKERVVVNGMSYHARDGINANAALLVQMYAKDFNDNYHDALKFIDEIEHQAYIMGGSNYQAPAQLVKDFLNHQPSTSLGLIKPTYSCGVKLSNLHDLLPKEVASALEDGLRYFPKQVSAYTNGDAILTAIETRSSSPVRINRNQELQSSNTLGIYPCGEGAGFAGGIVSSAIDGIKVAESIISNYCMID